MRFAPGYKVPPHSHEREDEATFVVEGALAVTLDGSTRVVGPGGFFVKAKGQVHAMENAGPGVARFLETHAPGGLEEYFRAMAGLFAAGNVTPQSLAAVHKEFGISPAP